MEGQKFERVFFIKKGEFEITKRCKMPGSSNDGAENPDKLRKGLFECDDLKAKNAERFY